MGRTRTQEIGPHQEFAKRLREALNAASLSPDDHNYKEIGKELTVSGSMVGYMLNGDKLPGLDKAVNIALRTRHCVEWLLTGKGPKKPVAITIDQEADSDIKEALMLLQGVRKEKRDLLLEMIRGAAHKP